MDDTDTEINALCAFKQLEDDQQFNQRRADAILLDLEDGCPWLKKRRVGFC